MPAKTQQSTQLAITEGNYYQVEIDGTQTKLAEASITLNDCLACSGCITSAESVLINMQSQDELFKILYSNAELRKTVVVSISSQARASFGAKYGLSMEQAWLKLVGYFKSIGVDEIFDVDIAREICLLESARSFVSKRSAQPTMASFCPGWICYAEKTHSDILNLIDTTKSPQQIMGSLVKDYFVQRIGRLPNDVYHVCVMPCYDKKLEASRQDFYNDLYNVRDVDLVLSTIEVERMVMDKFKDISAIPVVNYNSLFFKGDPNGFYSTEGSTSGGYLSFILRYAVHSAFNINLAPQDIELGRNGITLHPGRNSDFLGVYYTPPGHLEPYFRFAYAFGFRNIQNFVRKLKLKKQAIKYDFIEVAACPKSCINGGGQLKLDGQNTLIASKDWIDVATTVYRQPKSEIRTEINQHISEIIENWLGGLETKKARQMLHTEYHAVEKMDNNLNVKW